MNRALPFLAAVALVGGGLVYFTIQTDRMAQSGTESGTGPDVGGLGLEPASRPKITPEFAGESVEPVDDLPTTRGNNAPGGTAKLWEIIPMNTVGQRIDDAKITAVPSGELGAFAEPLTGEGRTRFEDVPAGPWELTVTAEGCPTWNRIIEVPASMNRYPTMVQLGDELRILGQINDTNGAPVKEPIYFLAKGTSHPKQLTTPGKPAKNEASAAGSILVSPSGSGRFKTTLPSAGEYRISVGAPGEARWTDAKATALTHGGTDYVAIVVPAKPQLTATFSEEPDARPSKLSVYYYDADEAARQLEISQLAEDAESGTGRAKGAQGADQKGLEGSEASAKSGKATGAASTKTPAKGRNKGQGGAAQLLRGKTDPSFVNPRNRQPLLQPGWRLLRGMSVPASGEFAISELPADKDLRFVIARNLERITTMTPLRLSLGGRMRAEFTLPIPTLEQGVQISDLATYTLTPRPTAVDEIQLSPGTEWSFATGPKPR